MPEAKSDREVLEPHLPSGETAVDMVRTKANTYLLTDRRFLVLEDTDDEDVTTVDSTFLDHLGGVRIVHKKPGDMNQDLIVIGILALFLAVVSFALMGQFDSGGATIVLLLVGLLTGGAGFLCIVEAINLDDGSVTIELQTVDGKTVQSVEFEEEKLEFAEAISRTVSNSHPPGSTTKRTVKS